MSIDGNVEVAHIEVAQVVQNMQNSVKLIAKKRGVARVLLIPHLSKTIVVTGTLQITLVVPGKDDEIKEIDSSNSTRLQATNHPDPRQLRRTIDGALNFRLPAELMVRGNLQLKLLRLQTLTRDTVEFNDRVHDLLIHAEVPFPLRILGMRYPDSRGRVRAPSYQQFDESRNFLNRTFPISNTDPDRSYPISTAADFDLIIDGPEGFKTPLTDTVEISDTPDGDITWEKNINLLHAYTMAIRGRDLDWNHLPQTRYYAMIDNAGIPFNAAASDVPKSPIPGTVAAGSVQRIGRNSEHYLIAHELGHTLGRLHPGACYGQKREDKHYPYCCDEKQTSDVISRSDTDESCCQGYISNDLLQHIGVDLTTDGAIRQLLLHDEWHDLMTYCARKWISAYTYEGILQRIRAESNLKFPRGAFIKVIGWYDFRNKSGEVLYAFPTRFDESPAEDDATSRQLVNLVVEYDQNRNSRRINVGGKRLEAEDMPDQTGVFQCTIPQESKIAYLRVDAGSATTKSIYRIGGLSKFNPAEREGFRVEVTRLYSFAESSLDIVPLSLPTGEENFLYTVRAEADFKWHNLYLGSHLPQRVHLDPKVFKPGDNFEVIVSLSDGISEIFLFRGFVS